MERDLILLNKRISRSKIINYIYYYELMDKKISSAFAFESGEFSNKEIRDIDMISKNYEKFKSLLEKHLNDDWAWNRLTPYIRSVLIFASFDFLFNDKAVVINEMILLTKGFSPDDSYKFVNGILDKIGDYYENIKRAKKNS